MFNLGLCSTKRLFQIEQLSLDNTFNAEIESFIISNIDSLKSIETTEAFAQKLHLDKAYKLERYPNIYFLDLVSDRISLVKDNYELLLFNCSDSALYHFDGYAPRFALVFQQYLPEVITDGNIIELIELYLNTLSANADYYIIGSSDDYRKIWLEDIASFDLKPPIPYYKSEELIEDDIKKVAGTICQPEIYNEGNYYEIFLYTWTKKLGKIEYWIFRISNITFVNYYHETKIEGVGPYVDPDI